MNQVKQMVVASASAGAVGVLASLESAGVSGVLSEGIGNWVNAGCPLTLLPFFHILSLMTLCILSCMVTMAMYANTYISLDVPDEPACNQDDIELPALCGSVGQVFEVWVLGAARCEKVYALPEAKAKAAYISDADKRKLEAFEEAYARWTNAGVKLTR